MLLTPHLPVVRNIRLEYQGSYTWHSGNGSCSTKEAVKHHLVSTKVTNFGEYLVKVNFMTRHDENNSDLKHSICERDSPATKNAGRISGQNTVTHKVWLHDESELNDFTIFSAFYSF